jgi:hypothetical protein
MDMPVLEAPSGGGANLGAEPLPPFEEIADDPEFELEVILKAEFEKVWAKATA